MDNDRYYQLGSHDKLFNQIDELTDALASRDAEIESLRQQHERDIATLECWNSEITELQKQLANSQKQVAMLRKIVKKVDLTINGSLSPQHRDWKREVEQALAATADLDKYILCDKEPASYLYKFNSAFGDGVFWSHRPTHNGDDALEAMPLYRAKEQWK